MRILVWHVHGGWMNAFLRGEHDYLVPSEAGHPPVVTGARVHVVEASRLREEEIDVVVLQRTEEIAAVERLTGRTPGKDLPAIFVEHNTPKRLPVTELHPLHDQHEIPIVHVTHFNRIAWDCGRARTRVIEHGVPDPGYRYTGELAALGVVINEPVRRGRVTGTDLLPRFARVAALDCFGIDCELLEGVPGLESDRLRIIGDLPTERLHGMLARRRAYLHPFRWTSLGLALLEAMTLGMPVIALATTEATRAVPPEAGRVSADLDELVAHARLLMDEPAEARRQGEAAREFALAHYGLARFLDEWDEMLVDTVAEASASHRRGSRTSAPASPQAALSTTNEGARS